MFPIFDVSTSGLVAQRTRLNAISSNIANISTTRNEQGQPEAREGRRRHGGNLVQGGGEGDGLVEELGACEALCHLADVEEIDVEEIMRHPELKKYIAKLGAMRLEPALMSLRPSLR